jgi:hypothetical protein
VHKFYTMRQTVKFGLLRGERVSRAEILAEFLSAHFQENPTKSACFDELMIYFVSYLLGLARENSENAISDHLDTPNFRHFLKCSAFISAQLPFMTKSSPRKNNTLQSGPCAPKIFRTQFYASVNSSIAHPPPPRAFALFFSLS